MKIKVLAILGLAATLGFGACKGATNTNTANTTNVAVATPTAVTKTNETAATDPNLKSKIEAALKAKGMGDVTVDTSTTPATLRGTVAKGKLAEVMATAQEANGGKPMKNEVTEK
jgi:ABC-type glycerol-3-phosphate transport system substrate-binding protein